MRGRSGYALALAVLLATVATSASAKEDSDVPAAPISRSAPAYPAKCVPASGDDTIQHRVVVAYDVSEDGFPENVSVNSSGEPAPVAFIEDFDARPLKRLPPRYPEKCMGGARSSEFVLIEFDVTEKGRTENIKVADSTNKCLEGAAETAVSKWLYAPKTLQGEPVRRNGVQTTVIFQLSGDRVNPSPDSVIRSRVWSSVKSIERSIKRGEAPEIILAKCAELEEKFGATLARAEAASFYHLRGIARLAAKDYNGALDDLRRARNTGNHDAKALEAFDRIIATLEEALGAPTSDTSAPAESDQDQDHN